MIFDNGYITIRKAANAVSDSLDKNGYPIVSAGANNWGDPIPCHYIPVSINYQAADKGGEKYTEASYKIIINLQAFDATSLRLFTKGEVLVGEYVVRSVRHNALVLTTRIMV